MDHYLSLVEWTGQNIREDKLGYVPLGLKPVLERFNLDTENWVRNVESYGGLFYRVAGPLELILARAREKGQSWLKGQSGSRQSSTTAQNKPHRAVLLRGSTKGGPNR